MDESGNRDTPNECTGGTAPYNYAHFPVNSDVDDFQRFPDIVKVGTRAPDPVLTDLNRGEPVQLSELTRVGITVLEFGSFT